MLQALHQQLKTKKISSQELVKNYLDKIHQRNPLLNAFLEITDKIARNQAQVVDNKIAQGKEIDMLAGLPAAIKDNIATRGIKTTAGSRILENYIPPYDATVIAKLKSSDFVLVGKTNIDEFAHGGSTENSAYGPTRNPWDITRVPGGSSGGSAAAVAAGLAVYALGTDTGGSIRQPAAFCSIVGLKPTYGRISRYGLLAMTSSTDVPGILTKTAADAAVVLQVLAGQDKKDATLSNQQAPNYSSEIKKDLKGLKAGIPKEYFSPQGMNPEVKQIVKQAIKEIEKLGVEIIEVSLPHTEYGVAVYYIITPCEISSNLARFDGIKFGCQAQNSTDLIDLYFKTRGQGFGSEAKRRIMLGTYALSSGYWDAYYLKAQKVRSLIIKDFKSSWAQADFLLTPTSPSLPFKIGEKVDNPLTLYLEDIFSVPASLAGLPAVSVPCGFSKDNLPVGLQIIGPHFKEEVILRVAHNYQQATDWHKKNPPGSDGV